MGLAESWESMLDGQLPEGISRRRLPSDSVTDVFIGIRSPERHPLLLVGVDEEGVAGFRSFEAEALEARLEHIRDGQQAICIELRGTEFIDIFATLCTDLLERVDGQPGRETAGVVATRLERWHELLHRRRRGLTAEQQRGLVAELAVLRMLHEAHPESPLHTIFGWCGPSGSTQDFVYDDFVIEVKGPAPKRSLKISSVPQLWPPEHTDRFHLVVVDVGTGEGGGPLLDHVNLTRDAFSTSGEDALLRLELHLEFAGWSDAEANRYPTSWVDAEPVAFEVRDDFPRLDPDELPLGVSVPRYFLSRDVLGDHRVPTAEVLSLRPLANNAGAH